MSKRQAFLRNLRPENRAHVEHLMSERLQIHALRRNVAFQSWSAASLNQYPELQRFAQKGDSTAGDVMVRALQVFSDPARTSEAAAVLGLSGKASRDEVLAQAAARYGYEDGRDLTRQVLEPIRHAAAADELTLRAAIRDEQLDRASGVERAIPDISEGQKAEVRDSFARRNEIANRMARAEQAAPIFERAKRTLYHPSTEMQADIARAMEAHAGNLDPVAGNSPGARAWNAGRTKEDRLESNLRHDTIRAEAQARGQAEEAWRSGSFRSPVEAAFIADVGPEGREHIPQDGFGGEFGPDEE